MGQLYQRCQLGFYSGVIVDTVTPPYYEPYPPDGLYKFDIYGSWLTNIPDGSVGYLSRSNGSPAQNVGQSGYRVYLRNKKFDHVEFSGNHNYAVSLYLGVIVAPDGTIVWTNQTRPLPS